MAPWPDPRYRELTPALLSSISADDIGGAIAQHVELRCASTGAVRGGVIDALPTGTRAIYTTWLVDVDVNDGGFNQFFFMRSARIAGQALAGYELLGAEDYAAVIRSAIATHESERDLVMPYYTSTSPDEFKKSYDVTELGEVDQRYYALGDRIYNVWAGFVRIRPELFAG